MTHIYKVSLFIELGLKLSNSSSAYAFIVPLAITSSDSMAALHELLLQGCEDISISTYSNRPKKIFANADQRVAILLAAKTGRPNEVVNTTKVNKRYSNKTIDDVINGLEYVNSKNFVRLGRIPKVGTNTELDILEKIFSIKNGIKELMDENGSPVYYRAAGGRYYNVVTTYPTGSTQEKKLMVNAEYQNLVGALLTSNLFYWFLHIYSDQLHIKSYELELFPVPAKSFSDDDLRHIERIYKAYLDDLEKNAKQKLGDYVHVDSFKEYVVRKSKHYIDELDKAIGKAYGLNKTEIDFLINYDLEFRLSE